MLSDPIVSSVHLELAPCAEGVTVRDLRSTNGTYTESMRFYLATLRGDFRLWLGRAEIQVRHPGACIEAPLWHSAKFGSLLGQSVAMRSLFEQLRGLVPTPFVASLPARFVASKAGAVRGPRRTKPEPAGHARESRSAGPTASGAARWRRLVAPRAGGLGRRMRHAAADPSNLASLRLTGITRESMRSPCGVIAPAAFC